MIAQDGTISFLEVNTRLQVEHPVSEEVTGLDLVREQFRIAEGAKLDYSDPEVRGHSFEFRINGEDAGRNFMPAPGPVHVFKAPSGPGVRVDTGVESGDEISGAFDSMIAKLICVAQTREEAILKMKRALDEYIIEGVKINQFEELNFSSLSIEMPILKNWINKTSLKGDLVFNKKGEQHLLFSFVTGRDSKKTFPAPNLLIRVIIKKGEQYHHQTIFSFEKI